MIEGETGVFFDDQRSESLRAALERFETLEFDPVIIRANAERFDSRVFADRIRTFVEAKHDEYERTFFRQSASS